MKHYELLFILPGTLSEDEVSPIVDKVKNILAEDGAQAVELESLGKNRLAYPIKHIRYGYFFLGHFQAETDQAAKIQNRLRLLEGVLRLLVKLYDPAKQSGKKFEYYAVESVEPMPRGERGRSERESRPAPQAEPEAKKIIPPAAEPAKEKDKPKVSLEEIDKKLDEILESDISNV